MFRWTVFILFLVVTHLVSGQQVHTGINLSEDQAIQSALKTYSDAVGQEAMIFNGSQYVESTQYSKGHPFYLSDEWEEGSVIYEGHQYKVSVLYDIAKDEIIIEHYDQQGLAVKLKVYQPGVSSFAFLGHSFARMNGDANQPSARPGFYEMLYDGKTKAVALRKKSAREEVSLSGAELIYLQKDRYFVVKDGQFNPISGKGSVLKAFSDKKKQVKDFMKERKLELKDNKAKDLSELVAFYDTLSHTGL